MARRSAYESTRRPGGNPSPALESRSVGISAMLTTWGPGFGFTFSDIDAFMSPMSGPVNSALVRGPGCPGAFEPTIRRTLDIFRRISHVHRGHLLQIRVGPAAHLHSPYIARAAHVHAAHVPHSHVGHRPQRARIHRRNQGTHPKTGGQCAARVAGAILRLSEDRVGRGVRWLRDHVVCFSNGDPELVDGYRFHVIPVGLHHGHRQTRYAHVEDRHRGSVDKAEANAFARSKEAGPIGAGRLAI